MRKNKPYAPFSGSYAVNLTRSTSQSDSALNRASDRAINLSVELVICSACLVFCVTKIEVLFSFSIILVFSSLIVTFCFSVFASSLSVFFESGVCALLRVSTLSLSSLIFTLLVRICSG